MSSVPTRPVRLLPLLMTRLSFREIGATLQMPREAVQAEAISVYRKLGVRERRAPAPRDRHLRLMM